jgi:hypothetical protein
MTVRRFARTALIVTLAGASIAFAACGGDDDDAPATTMPGDAVATAPGGQGQVSSGTSAAPTATSAATQPAAKASGTDREYVKVVCAAFDRYQKDLSAEITKNPNATSDPAAFFKAILPSLETVVSAIDRANPPADVSSYHAALLKQNRGLIADIRANKIQTIQDFTARVNTEQPSAAIQARLAAAAKDEPACANSLVFMAPQ